MKERELLESSEEMTIKSLTESLEINVRDKNFKRQIVRLFTMYENDFVAMDIYIALKKAERDNINFDDLDPPDADSHQNPIRQNLLKLH